MTINKCPVCDSDQLIGIEENVSLRADDFEREMTMHATECASCGCSFHTPEQERFNKRQRMAFRKLAEGLLTGEQIRAIRERHGLTQKQAAEIFGGGPVAFAKYEAGDVAQSQAMDRLLRVFDQLPAAKVMLMGGVAEKPNAQSLIETQSGVAYHIILTTTRRQLNAEEDVRESLCQMLKHIEGPPEARRPVEWRVSGKPASEWRH